MLKYLNGENELHNTTYVNETVRVLRKIFSNHM